MYFYYHRFRGIGKTKTEGKKRKFSRKKFEQLVIQYVWYITTFRRKKIRMRIGTILAIPEIIVLCSVYYFYRFNAVFNERMTTRYNIMSNTCAFIVRKKKPNSGFHSTIRIADFYLFSFGNIFFRLSKYTRKYLHYNILHYNIIHMFKYW